MLRHRAVRWRVVGQGTGLVDRVRRRCGRVVWVSPTYHTCWGAYLETFDSAVLRLWIAAAQETALQRSRPL